MVGFLPPTGPRPRGCTLSGLERTLAARRARLPPGLAGTEQVQASALTPGYTEGGDSVQRTSPKRICWNDGQAGLAFDMHPTSCPLQQHVSRSLSFSFCEVKALALSFLRDVPIFAYRGRSLSFRVPYVRGESVCSKKIELSKQMKNFQCNQ